MEDAKEALIGWETDPTDDEIEYTLDSLPKVDAVEVVRCKDCKQWNCVTKPKLCDKRHGYCLNDDEPVGKWEDDYCSYGERKDDGR